MGVPLSGNVLWIYGVSTIYILLALALGLLISTAAQTQFVALLMSAMVLLLPSVMLSGMMFPLESMPEIIQYVSLVLPPRWYISAMRKLMVMGVGIDSVLTEVGILSVMTVGLVMLALKKFQNRLE